MKIVNLDKGYTATINGTLDYPVVKDRDNRILELPCVEIALSEAAVSIHRAYIEELIHRNEVSIRAREFPNIGRGRSKKIAINPLLLNPDLPEEVTKKEAINLYQREITSRKNVYANCTSRPQCLFVLSRMLLGETVHSSMLPYYKEGFTNNAERNVIRAILVSYDDRLFANGNVPDTPDDFLDHFPLEEVLTNGLSEKQISYIEDIMNPTNKETERQTKPQTYSKTQPDLAEYIREHGIPDDHAAVSHIEEIKNSVKRHGGNLLTGGKSAYPELTEHTALVPNLGIEFNTFVITLPDVNYDLTVNKIVVSAYARTILELYLKVRGSDVTWASTCVLDDNGYKIDVRDMTTGSTWSQFFYNTLMRNLRQEMSEERLRDHGYDDSGLRELLDEYARAHYFADGYK